VFNRLDACLCSITIKGVRMLIDQFCFDFSGSKRVKLKILSKVEILVLFIGFDEKKQKFEKFKIYKTTQKTVNKKK
jgi:hypothetical protein